MTIRDSVAGIASKTRADGAKLSCAEAAIAASEHSGPEQITIHIGNKDKTSFMNLPIPSKSLGIAINVMSISGHSVPTVQT